MRRCTSNHLVPATLLVTLIGAAGCSSTGPATPPPLRQVGMRTCTNTLHVSLAQDGRHWSHGDAVVVLTRPSYGLKVQALPATITFDWDVPVYRRGDEPLTTRAQEAGVAVSWTGPHSGSRLRHDERVWIDCDASDSVLVTLPWEIQVQVSTDPADVSVFALPGPYRTPRFVGTTPLTTTLLHDPSRAGRWHFQLEKSGMRTDTLVMESPRHGQLYRVVLQPLPYRGPPSR